jgi:DNA ligase (NAD+)
LVGFGLTSLHPYIIGPCNLTTFFLVLNTGCVHKVADFDLRRELGHSNRAPRWAVAHKFQSQTAITRLLDIEVQVGRTGVLTPVAVLEPVDLQGVTVQRATLHNFQHARKVLLGDGDAINASTGDTSLDRIPGGCHVLIRRAGEVIPQVLQRVHNVDSSEMGNFISLSVPNTCPGCGAPAVISGTSSVANLDTDGKNLAMDTSNTVSTMDVTGPVLRCSASTLTCPPRATLAMAHAFSRGALDVRGLSKARIEQLMNATTAADDILGGYRIRQPSDIFRLAQNASKLESLQQLDGWGPKSVQNLANTLNGVATEGVSLARFIYSLGIRNAGIHASSLIAEAYNNNVDAFLDDVAKAALVPTIKHNDDEDGSCPRSFDTLRQDNNMTKGIGPILLSELQSFAREEDLVEAAKDLAQCVLIHSANNSGLESLSSSQSDQEEMTKRPLEGMTVVFTGTIVGLSRSEANELARKNGAKATPGTISKSTNLVVRGSKSGKKKTEQAEALSVRIMDADDFLAWVNKQ